MRYPLNISFKVGNKNIFPGAVLLIIVLSGCNVNQHLQEEEYFLEFQNINIEERVADLNFRENNRLERKLFQQLRQTPNSYFLWVPRQWYYYNIANESDTSGIQQFVLKNIAEEPVHLSTEISKRTASDMTNYMRGEGYFKADSRFHFDTLGKHKGSVTYTALPGKRSYVDSLFYSTPDSNVLSILHSNRSNTYLKPDAPISQTLYSQEVDRLTDLLRNRGYAEFYPDYIEPLKIDTAEEGNNVYFEIRSPADAAQHKVFENDRINVWLNYNPDMEDTSLYRDTIEGINFISTRYPFKIDPSVLNKNVYLRPGELYAAEQFDLTIRQLGDLGILKYPNISQSLDTSGTPRIDYDIYLRTNPKYSWQSGIELFYSNISQINLLGVSGSVGITDRNAFGGAEELSIGVEGSVELGLGNSELNTYNFSASTDLLMPTFKPVFGLLKGLNNIRFGGSRLLGNTAYEDFTREAKTRVEVGFDYASVQNLYNYYSLSSSYGYELRNNSKHSYEFNQLGLNYWNPTIKPAFDTIIGDNEFFRNSFNERLFTGIFFRDFTYNFKSSTNRFGESYSFFGNFEVSGLEVLAANSIYNAIANEDKEFTLSGSNIEFSKYLRAEVEGRYNKTITSRTSWAARLNIGIAVPLGPDQNVPYLKQFFIGGPYSIRAWQARGLGPGEFRDTTSQTFYQKGDFKLELNGEYRFDLFWLMEGAVFLDIGNVWNLEESESDDIKTALSWKFYEQLAVGTGFGFRFDFSYFLIRLDFGYRLRTPYPDEDGHHWSFEKEENFALGDDLQLQVGLDYPF